MIYDRLRVLPVLVFGLSLSTATAWADPITVFSSGSSYTVPETITPIPAGFGSVGGNYFVPDANSGKLLVVPAAGGTPTVFASIPGGVPISGLFVPPGYGSLSGTFLVTGGGSAATVSSAGTVSPLTLTSAAGVEGSTVAPAGFGTVGGKILLGNTTTGGSQILVLNPNGTTSVFATVPVSDPFTLGFAPAGFGSVGGDLLVSDANSGNLYAVDASGNVSLFDTLPTPEVADQTTGLREFTFAPDGYGAYGGDLVISVSGSSDGGGTYGSIDIVSGSGALVGQLLEGTVGQPYDPRGLYFDSSNQLLASDAEPGSILAITEDAFNSNVTPEPASWTLLMLGLCGVVAVQMQKRKPRSA